MDAAAAGRWTTTRSRRSGTSWRARSVALARRSPSSYHCGASRRPTSAATRAGSRPRGVAANAVSDPGPAARSSRYRSRRATTVDGWWLTAAYTPGESWITRLTARSTIGVETGLRPSPCRDGAPSSSASRNIVRTSIAAAPPRRPSARRAITPAVLVGTMTATGASGSPPLAAATAAASASSAAAPCRVNVTLTAMPRIVRTGCHTRVFAAVRVLVRAASGAPTLRWRQTLGWIVQRKR